MSNSLISVDQATGDVLREIDEALRDIPYGNSDFQNRAFVVASQITPARGLRAAGLRMHDRIRAIKEFKYNQAVAAIDREERDEKIADPETDKYERRRLLLENAKADEDASWTDKMLTDALRELNCLYVEFKKFPRYTREQFEAEERDHFGARMHRQLNAPGPNESVCNIVEDLPQWEARIAAYAAKMLDLKE